MNCFESPKITLRNLNKVACLVYLIMSKGYCVVNMQMKVSAHVTLSSMPCLLNKVALTPAGITQWSLDDSHSKFKITISMFERT